MTTLNIVVSVNQVGGQDELVFDGGSFVVDETGKICAAAENFTEDDYSVSLDFSSSPVIASGMAVAPQEDVLQSTWQALVLGVRDYVNKNRFPSVVLGLSGGVDSALTLAVAVDAPGPDWYQDYPTWLWT
jgi:NAD+ synthase (glutamine-hydrolysing)